MSIQEMNKAGPSRHYKIIDCLTFFNELELLRLRINMLSAHVDHFVIAEAHQTHTGIEKECLLNQEHAADIVNHPKVTVKKVHLPRNATPLERENFQRDALFEPAHNLSTSNDDIILLSDIDEIPSPEAIERAVMVLHQSDEKKLAVLEQRLFYFRLNYELVFSRKLPWLGTTATKAVHKVPMSRMRTTGRNLRGRKHRHLNDEDLLRMSVPLGGWHFSYMGDKEVLNQKLASFSHQEAAVQQAKLTRIDELIASRGSLFPRLSAHETWAVVPMESLGLPLEILAGLQHSSLVTNCPCTPLAEIVKDAISKSLILSLSIGNMEISLRKKPRNFS
jgi:beta-1,4-mannosyl-glycoprotein beta-1,4-N-acetylglucosaminyltransferase